MTAFSCKIRNLFAKRQEGFPPDFSIATIDTIERVLEYTMTSPERISALISAVEHVEKHSVPGAIVECGVWRGGSMMAAAITLTRLGSFDRELYLYDTFSGMSAATPIDLTLDGRDATDLMNSDPSRTSVVWAVASKSDVIRNLQQTGYPSSALHFVEGAVTDTLPGGAPDTIAILRLDTDWYESTLHELITLYPRLSPGGVLIIDDYGHWQGAKRAVDEYFADLPVFLARIDYTGRLAIKPWPGS